jgi:hypothetical protein
MSTPGKTLKAKIKDGVNYFYEIDEFRTSKLCASCHQPMKQLLVEKKEEKEKEAVDLKNALLSVNLDTGKRLSKKKRAIVEDERKKLKIQQKNERKKRKEQRKLNASKNIQQQQGQQEPTMVKSWIRKECVNPDCKRRVWDRNVNAAINMLYLFFSEWADGTRPLPFSRSHSLEDNEEEDDDDDDVNEKQVKFNIRDAQASPGEKALATENVEKQQGPSSQENSTPTVHTELPRLIPPSELLPKKIVQDNTSKEPNTKRAQKNPNENKKGATKQPDTKGESSKKKKKNDPEPEAYVQEKQFWEKWITKLHGKFNSAVQAYSTDSNQLQAER